MGGPCALRISNSLHTLQDICRMICEKSMAHRYIPWVDSRPFACASTYSTSTRYGGNLPPNPILPLPLPLHTVAEAVDSKGRRWIPKGRGGAIHSRVSKLHLSPDKRAQGENTLHVLHIERWSWNLGIQSAVADLRVCRSTYVCTHLSFWRPKHGTNKSDDL